MLEAILQVVRRWKAVSNSLFMKWVHSAQDYLEKIFSLSAFLPSQKYPFVPNLVGDTIDFGLETFDLILDALELTPFLVAGTLIADQFKVPGELRKRVMTLDQAALIPVKVILEQGFRNVRSPLPVEWQAFTVVDRIGKVESVIKSPTLKNAWKLLFGSLWGRIVRVLLLIINLAKLLGLLVCLWNYTKAVMDKTNWPVIFSGTLSQRAKRKYQRTEIYRRIGGVKP